ncbi:hypothetical protein [Phycicoccus avicenniae]|uniref:hypothetical protein n=1 Tax=Phycicoccus avicenniae TaxID=2828860 RepID=UPI003D2690B6
MRTSRSLVQITAAAVAAVGWGVLLTHGVNLVRADRIYGVAFRDGLKAGGSIAPTGTPAS